MPLVPNFTSTESLSSPNLVTFSDTSTGSDGTITTRTITVVYADGTTQTFDWVYTDASIQVNLLTKSQAATVTVEWFADPSNPYVYVSVQDMEWNLYDYLFLFGLLSTQTSKPTIISDLNYYSNTAQMIVNLFQAEKAILKMSDVYSAQSSLDRNFFLMSNQNLYF